MERKTFRGQMKLEGDQGAFKAEFATLGVVDYDTDVTVKGAFSNEPVLIEPWNHDRTLPVGKGAIREEGDKAIVEGVFFLDTVAGSEHYKTVKNMGDLQEWSYSFDILEHEFGDFGGQNVRFLKKLHVIGVGPVTRGAGVNTRTVDIKEADSRQQTADSEKHTASSASQAEGETPDQRKPSGEAGRVVLRADLDAIEYGVEVSDGNQGKA